MEKLQPVPLCLPSNFKWNPQNKKLKVVHGAPRGDVVLCNEGLALLEGINDDLVVVLCITGPSRSGKSYFLSQMQDGVEFETGHSTTSKTTGIWIAVAPKFIKVNGANARLVLLDAEGLGSTSTVDDDGSNERWDRKMFTICALISSYLIYNSKGVPHSDDLDKLSFIEQFRTSLYGHSPPSGCMEDSIDVAPYFMWLIRDALLQPEIDGTECSWKTFIESSVLSIDEGSPTSRRNAIKTAIRSSFKYFNSYGLPPPSADLEVVQNLSSPKYEDSIRIFLTRLQEVKEEILSCLQVKEIKRHQLTGKQLATYLSSCVIAVNHQCEKFPIQSAWDSLLELKWNEIFKRSMEKYDKQANTIPFPVSTADVEKFHNTAGNEVRKDFIQFLSSNFDKESSESYKRKLEIALEEKLKGLHDRNQRESRRHCESLAVKLEKQYFEKVVQNINKHSYVELVNAKDTVMKEFLHHGKGIMLDEVKRELEDRMSAKISSLQPALILSIRDEIWEMYDKEVRVEVNPCLPLETDSLRIKHRSIAKHCIEQFEAKCRGCDTFHEVLSKLEKDLEKRLHSLEVTNFSRSRDACDKIMRSCKRTHFNLIWERVKEVSISDVLAAKKSVLDDYKKKAVGPARDEIERKYSEEMEDQLIRAKSLISENALDEARKEYKRKLDQLLKNGPLDIDEANQESRSAWENVQKCFQARCDGLGDSLQRVYKEKLNRVQDEIVNSFHQRNEQLSTESCEKLMTTLIRDILKPSIDKTEIFVSYEEKKQLILDKYEQDAKGPSRDKVRNEFVPKIDTDIKRAEQQRILRGLGIALDCAAAGFLVAPGVSKSAKVAATTFVATAKVGLNEFNK